MPSKLYPQCAECGTYTMHTPDDGESLFNPAFMTCEHGHVTEPIIVDVAAKFVDSDMRVVA